MEDDRVPVTVITGFLGSGKSTLLNNILSSPVHTNKETDQPLKFAVIENELGKVSIDNQILTNKAELQREEIIEVTNGCICCHVRGDLVRALQNLYSRVIDMGLHGIILETTGLADPAPIVQTFFNHPDIERLFRIDGVVTVVDAKHIVERLDEVKPDGVVNEASEQIAFADKILLNKIDLIVSEDGTIDESKLLSIEETIKSINPTAKILRTKYSKVDDNNELIRIGGFDVARALDMDKDFLTVTRKHRKDRRVKSIAREIPGEVSLMLLQQWLEDLANGNAQQQQQQHDHNHAHDHNHDHDHNGTHLHGDDSNRPPPTNLYRYKGIIAVKGMDQKFIFQGVGMIMGSYFSEETWDVPAEERTSQFVFIGKDLDKDQIERSFEEIRVMGDLRFTLGASVEANIGSSFAYGQVVSQWDQGNAYRIRLDDTGDEVFAPIDHDSCVRLPSFP